MDDVTMTHGHCERTTQCTNGVLTHRVSSTGDPQSDGALNNEASIKLGHYLQLYVDRSDPIVFLTVVVNISGHVYDDFVRLLFFWTCTP